MMVKEAPVSVIETPEFISATGRMMDEEERALLVDYLACNPAAGGLFPARAACESCDGPCPVAANGAARG